MSQHYCQEHATSFLQIKKGKFAGQWAHPIEDTEPLKWCNEPPQVTVGKDNVKESPKRQYGKSPEEIASIEMSVAVKAIADLVIAGILPKNHVAFRGALNWLTQKVMLNYAMKETDYSPTPTDEVKVPQAKDTTHIESPSSDYPSFATGTDLINYALKERRMSLEAIKKVCPFNKPTDIKNPDAMAKVLFG